MTTEPVTIEQAAALLGVSASTVRRRIRAGILQVTETRRPQGTVWLVHLPPGVRPATATDTVDTASVTTAPSEQPAASATQAEAISTLVQTTVAAVLGPLVAELAASRQTNERQAEQIAELREERGRLIERLALAAPTGEIPQSPADSPVAPNLRPDPAPLSNVERFTTSWRPALWAFALAAIVLAIVAGVWAAWLR